VFSVTSEDLPAQMLEQIAIIAAEKLDRIAEYCLALEAERDRMSLAHDQEVSQLEARIKEIETINAGLQDSVAAMKLQLKAEAEARQQAAANYKVISDSLSKAEAKQQRAEQRATSAEAALSKLQQKIEDAFTRVQRTAF